MEEFGLATNISAVPEYLLLNCAVRQDGWKGVTHPLSEIDAGLPSYMRIDCVSAWSLNPWES